MLRREKYSRALNGTALTMTHSRWVSNHVETVAWPSEVSGDDGDSKVTIDLLFKVSILILGYSIPLVLLVWVFEDITTASTLGWSRVVYVSCKIDLDNGVKFTVVSQCDAAWAGIDRTLFQIWTAKDFLKSKLWFFLTFNVPDSRNGNLYIATGRIKIVVVTYE